MFILNLAFVAMLRLAAVLYLIHVHGPDGKQEIEINVTEITSIRQPREKSADHFADGTNCLVYMTNGQFVSTHEPCLEIINKISALDLKRDEK